MKVIFETDNGWKPVEVEGVEFKFSREDKIKSLANAEITGVIKDIVFQNGYYWYDFTDGSSMKVDRQDRWEKDN